MTGLLLVLSLCFAPVQQAPAAAPQQPASDRLNGVWDLNKDNSTRPMAARGEPGSQGEQGGRGGGRPSGGGGGRGGGMRGGGGREGGNGEDMRKAREVMQEIGQSPIRLNIVSRPESVSISDPDGVVRKFAIDGKTEKVAINGSAIEVKSKWDGDVLSQEFKVGSAKFVRTVETTTDGHQLVITIKPKGDSGAAAGPAVLRFVYDRAPLR